MWTCPARWKVEIPNLVFCMNEIVAYVSCFGYNNSGYLLQSICSVDAEFDKVLIVFLFGTLGIRENAELGIKDPGV